MREFAPVRVHAPRHLARPLVRPPQDGDVLCPTTRSASATAPETRRLTCPSSQARQPDLRMDPWIRCASGRSRQDIPVWDKMSLVECILGRTYSVIPHYVDFALHRCGTGVSSQSPDPHHRLVGSVGEELLPPFAETGPKHLKFFGVWPDFDARFNTAATKQRSGMLKECRAKQLTCAPSDLYRLL
jgi:hypothetical protein